MSWLGRLNLSHGRNQKRNAQASAVQAEKFVEGKRNCLQMRMNQNELQQYVNAPDGMEPSAVKYLFEQILYHPKPADEQEALMMAQALWEVSDRQWHTYTILDDPLKMRLNDWIIANWISTSPEMTGLVILIISHIGLKEALDHLKASLGRCLPDSVRKKIQEALREFEKTVEDPYSGMK